MFPLPFFEFCGPPQALRASSPKGTPLRYAGNCPATAKSRPLGEGGKAAGFDRRGIPCRATLSQKAALQMQLTVMTAPVKNSVWSGPQAATNAK